MLVALYGLADIGLVDRLVWYFIGFGLTGLTTGTIGLELDQRAQQLNSTT